MLGSYIIWSKTFNFSGDTWGINTAKSGVYHRVLDRILNQLYAMQSYHNKLHVIRFDLHVGAYTPDNTMMTTFKRRLFKRLYRRYDFKRIGYVWVREQEKSKNQHYHWALILDGSKVNYPHKTLELAKLVWEEMSGSIWVPDNCYYNVKRGDKEAMGDVVFRLSYFAKARGKGYRPPQTKDYQTSRVKFKEIPVIEECA